ncbi:hypothetical protein DWB58_31290 [candidate division KSB1 bacterium]|nr:hypothetical protein [candidate division KSB1 bacterium]MDL1879054.1 hypothetical protein [Cytophagia bacterium CHB2]
MSFFFRQATRRSFAVVCVIAHFATCLLTLWFHQHPGHDHAGVKGEFYHSHIPAVASHAPEFEQDHHSSRESLHLLEGSSLFDKMHASIAVHFAQIFIPGKFVPQIDFFAAPFVENSTPNSVVKIVLKLTPLQLVRDYFALTATGLSPPLA